MIGSKINKLNCVPQKIAKHSVDNLKFLSLNIRMFMAGFFIDKVCQTNKIIAMMQIINREVIKFEFNQSLLFP